MHAWQSGVNLDCVLLSLISIISELALKVGLEHALQHIDSCSCFIYACRAVYVPSSMQIQGYHD